MMLGWLQSAVLGIEPRTTASEAVTLPLFHTENTDVTYSHIGDKNKFFIKKCVIILITGMHYLVNNFSMFVNL